MNGHANGVKLRLGPGPHELAPMPAWYKLLEFLSVMAFNKKEFSILYVEDDEQDIEAMRRALTGLKHASIKLHWARSVKEGVEALKQESYNT